MRRPLAVARVLADIAAADDARPVKGGVKHRRVTGHVEPLERFTRRAAERVKSEGFAARVDDVVKESAKLRAGELRGRIGDGLNQLVELQFGGKDLAEMVERGQDLRLL